MAGLCSQESEASGLKEKYGPKIRVIKDVGDFKHVVNFRPEGLDLAVKFQLLDTYPKSPPQIMIQSKVMHAEQVDDMKSVLASKAASIVGTNMLENLVEKAMAWITDQGLETILETSEDKSKGKGKKKGKKPKAKNKPVEDEPDEKKVSMKTAEDVISRIRWDESLSAEDFQVGYIDRFIGVIEKSFTSFSWEDIASVDYTVLAIPKHRIQYFKYKKVKVWDKPSRLDNMFGSTGSNITITDVIKQYEKFAAQIKAKDTAEAKGAASDSDDDDIEINVGQIKEKSYVDVSSDEESHWQNKLRPNYFICMRITDKDIQEAVACMQDDILDNEPRYAECIVPPSALHVTLCTLGLDTQEQLAGACKVLKEAKDELATLAQKKIQLSMKGVTNFYNRVLYAVIHHDEKLMAFVDHLRLILAQGGIEIRDRYDFVPHMTIMKTTRPVSRAMKTKDISPGLYDRFTDMTFEYQVVDALYLCPMTRDRREDGFYETLAEVPLL